MVNRISIKMFDSDKILNDIMFLGQMVILKGQELLVDLIVFEMPNSNMILGMNVLIRYGTEINCRKKRSSSTWIVEISSPLIKVECLI